MSDDDDDPPHLSAETFAALQEFYAEQQKRQEIFNKLEEDNQLKENVLFDENWQLSQFWYSPETARLLASAAAHVLSEMAGGSRTALVACPTLMAPLRSRLGAEATVTLLEYDRRFEVYAPNFIFYDYNYPEKLPPEIYHSYDLVIADPPFLSKECFTKVAQTIKLLAKGKIIVCTGAVMKDLVEKTLQLHQCEFQPQHRNNLANEFSCYANFDLDSAIR